MTIAVFPPAFHSMALRSWLSGLAAAAQGDGAERGYGRGGGEERGESGHSRQATP
ncbi:MAG: hypothetical protein K0R44_2324, partial [Thermomicrobiales bacterium]|nr:hypothetical protein [Thermomicrobiales bacterium]